MEKVPYLQLDNFEIAESYLRAIFYVIHRELCFGSEFSFDHLGEDKIEDYFETSLFAFRKAIHAAMTIEDIVSESAVTLPFTLRAYFETSLRYFVAKAQKSEFVDADKMPTFVDTPDLIRRIENANVSLNVSHLRDIWGMLSNYSHCNVPFTDLQKHIEKDRVALMTTTFPYWLGSSIITRDIALESFACLYFMTEMRALWFCVQRIHEYARYFDRDIAKESVLGKMETCTLTFKYSRQTISDEFGIEGGPFGYVCGTLLRPELYNDEYIKAAKVLSDIHLAALHAGVDVSFEKGIS